MYQDYQPLTGWRCKHRDAQFGVSLEIRGNLRLTTHHSQDVLDRRGTMKDEMGDVILSGLTHNTLKNNVAEISSSALANELGVVNQQISTLKKVPCVYNRVMLFHDLVEKGVSSLPSTIAIPKDEIKGRLKIMKALAKYDATAKKCLKEKAKFTLKDLKRVEKELRKIGEHPARSGLSQALTAAEGGNLNPSSAQDLLDAINRFDQAFEQHALSQESMFLDADIEAHATSVNSLSALKDIYPNVITDKKLDAIQSKYETVEWLQSLCGASRLLDRAADVVDQAYNEIKALQAEKQTPETNQKINQLAQSIMIIGASKNPKLQISSIGSDKKNFKSIVDKATKIVDAANSPKKKSKPSTRTRHKHKHAKSRSKKQVGESRHDKNHQFKSKYKEVQGKHPSENADENQQANVSAPSPTK